MPNPRTTNALVLHGIRDLRLEKHTLPPPAADEVQVSVKRTGLCGSDLHYYTHFRNGDIHVREPLCLGHESAGIVTAVGSGVTHLAVGDHVALEVGIPCQKAECSYCNPNPKPNSTQPRSRSRYNLCPNLRFRSSAKSIPHYQGTLQTALNHPASFTHKLPRNISLDLGALIEPLSVAMHAAHRSQIDQTPGANVLVFGAGAVGLLCAYMARRHGAREVLIADINAARVTFAVERGFATVGVTVNPTPAKQQDPPSQPSDGNDSGIDAALQTAQRTAAQISQTPLPARGPSSSSSSSSSSGTFGAADLTFECTGSASCTQASIYATAAGGKVMLVGMGTAVQTLPLAAAALREVDLLGVFRYAGTYESAVAMLAGAEAGAGAEAHAGEGVGAEAHAGDRVVEEEGEAKGLPLPDLRSLVTHRVRGLERAAEAFELAGRREGVDLLGRLVIKVMVEVEDQEEDQEEEVSAAS